MVGGVEGPDLVKQGGVAKEATYRAQRGDGRLEDQDGREDDDDPLDGVGDRVSDRGDLREREEGNLEV